LPAPPGPSILTFDCVDVTLLQMNDVITFFTAMAIRMVDIE